MTLACALTRAGPFLLVFLLAAMPARATMQRRFAVIAGNDRGGADMRPLRFAAEDARKMHGVLTHLGGVAPSDVIVLLNQPAGELWRAVGYVETRIAEARARGERTLFLFYYSGHAKDGELRLGDSRVRLDDIKARLVGSPADIRIGVFDSCRAGALNRTKGARRAPAFAIEATGSEEARGLVMLTSASADEDAQESDEIGGSYFSHYLVSGLRGDADRSRDRRVTLSEAYAYAYARTVADTAESAAGAQHPTFSYDLKGNADLVLTEFATHGEGLYVPGEAPAGTYYVIDGNGFIAAEIHKPGGVDRQLALPPGRYRIRRRLADRLRIGEVQIVSGQLTAIDENRLRDAPFSDDPIKGARDDDGMRVTLGLGGTVQSFFDGPTRDSLFPPTGMLGLELELHDFFRRGWLLGLDFGSGGTRAQVDRYGTLLPFQFSELTAGTTVAKEWRLRDSRVSLSVGMRVALVVMGRKFDDRSVPDQYFATFTPGLVTGFRYRLARHFLLLGRGRVHYMFYNVDQTRSLAYWELSAGAAYEF